MVIGLAGVVHAPSFASDALVGGIASATASRHFAESTVGASHLHNSTTCLPLSTLSVVLPTTWGSGSVGQASNAASAAQLEAFATGKRA